MRRVLALLLLVLGAAVATAEPTGVPTLKDPFPFDHGGHERIFEKTKTACVACHPVGLREGEGEDLAAAKADLSGPRSSCHGCHLGEARKMPRGTPHTCTTCHANRAELLPDTHGIHWLAGHGEAARARGSDCESCHEPRTCLACHETRGPVTRNPHPPGFGRTHGVEARLDPMSCTSCHTGDSCTACHTTGARPW